MRCIISRSKNDDFYDHSNSSYVQRIELAIDSKKGFDTETS
jgi:hypothetical protein